MAPFVLKKFTVQDETSSMRVGTDALLLGSICQASNSTNVLEIGCGCGIISLMLAQKSKSNIIAIEPDLPSYKEAQLNFNRSPWVSRLSAFNLTLQEYTGISELQFDTVVGNPPYYSNSLLSGNSRKDAARHGISLNSDEIFFYAEKMLTLDGSIWIIIPLSETSAFNASASSVSLFPGDLYYISTTNGKVPIRVILRYSRYFNAQPKEYNINIKSQDGSYSQDYKDLLHDFHPFL